MLPNKLGRSVMPNPSFQEALRIKSRKATELER